MRPFRTTLLAGLFTVALFAQIPPDLDRVVAAVQTGVDPNQAMAFMRKIYSTDRWFTFPKFQETAEYLRRTMTGLGLKNVELLGAPADGLTQAGYWTMPLAWDARRGTLEIVDPALPPDARSLADYRKIPSSLGMWSGPTTPGGVIADLIELRETQPAAIAKMDLRGKLVMTADPRNIKTALARAGALGAVNTFTEDPDLKDGRQWINGWGDNGWAFTKGSSPLLSFSISPRQADRLRALLRRRGSVKVKALVESRYYSGVYPIVTGVIPGRDGAEEVLILGHSSEQGAEDNATGVAAMLEAMGALNRLIQGGSLPRPRRSIRILTMGELYGSMRYVATHPERIKRTVAAICLDTPAASYGLSGTEYTFYMNPHIASSYVDAFILKVAAAYFPKVKRPWHSHVYASGTDTYLSDPEIGVPTTWGYSGSGVETHHNSEDTPDRVDPRSLRDISIVAASYLYYLANAGPEEAEGLGELALSRGYEQVLQSIAPTLDRIAVAPDSQDLSRELYAALDRISYQVAQQRQAIESAQRLAPQVRPALSGLSNRLDEFGARQKERVIEAAARRAAQLGIPRPIVAQAPPPDPQLKLAASMIVRRKRFGSLPLDDLPVEEREGYPSGAWALAPTTALYWCDGRRTLAEVIGLTREELGPDKFDYTGYFQFLQRHGYVEVLKSPLP